MAGSEPPAYSSESSIAQPSITLRSISFTQSATNVLTRVLSNLSVGGTEVSYRVNDSEILCSICLEEMDEEEGNLITVSGCSHTFHKDCIAKWKKMSRKCPCCRGELSDEIGPTLSKLQNLPAEEVPQNMSSSDIFRNIISSPVGILIPLLLFSLYVTFGALLFCPVMILCFWMGFKALCEDEDANLLPFPAFIVLFVILYTFFVAASIAAFSLQIIYVLYRTLKFYAMVFMCKLRWSDAKAFILDRTRTLANHYMDN